MTKYYIDFGGYTCLKYAGNPYQACMHTLLSYLEKYQDCLPVAFRVSQKGFDIHEDDEIIETSVVVKMLFLNRHHEEAYNQHE